MLFLGVIRVADALHGSACRLTADSHNHDRSEGKNKVGRTLEVNYYAILARPRRTILVSRSHRHNLLTAYKTYLLTYLYTCRAAARPTTYLTFKVRLVTRLMLCDYLIPYYVFKIVHIQSSCNTDI